MMTLKSLSILVALSSFFSLSSFGQEKHLNMVRIIDTVLTISSTNNTGNDLVLDLSASKSIVLTVPKGKVWIINMAQTAYLGSGSVELGIDKNFSSRRDFKGYLEINDGGGLVIQNGAFAGRAMFNSGTTISLGMYSIYFPYDFPPGTFKWFKHEDHFPKTYVVARYLMSITEYELVP